MTGRLALACLVAAAFAGGLAAGRATTLSSSEPSPTWTVAGELSRARSYARAVALATGEILVVGGLDPADPSVTVSTSELFDPTTGRVTVLPQLLLGRLNQGVTVAWGDRVVVTGGTDRVGEAWRSVARVDVYLPWSRTWLAATSMRQARSDHIAVPLLDGRVLVAGGNRDTELLRSSEIYDPRTDTWEPTAPLPHARTQARAVTLPDGRVLVVGGWELEAGMTTTTLLYDPLAERWAEGPELRYPRLNHSVVQLPYGDVLVFGGEASGSGTAERYVWREDRFVHAGVLGHPRLVAQGALLPDGSVVAVGGLPEDPYRWKFLPVTGAEVWDATKRVWRDIVAAPTARAFGQLVVTDTGIYRISGVGEDEAPLTTIEALTWR